MKKILYCLIMTLSTTVYANEVTQQQGEDLHNQKCTSCHASDVYSRQNRKVQSMPALENQVNNCMKGAANADWTQPQTTSVIDFLNERYYRF